MTFLRFAALLPLFALATACSNSTAPTALAPTATSGLSLSGSPGKSGNPVKSGGAAVAGADFVAEFLKAVQAGKASPALLTANFKKAVAPSSTEANRAAGYSDWGAESWLAELKTMVGTANVQTYPMGDGATVATAAPPQPGVGRTVVLLVKEGATVKVDHLYVAPAGSESNLGTDTAAAYAATAFADLVLTRQPRLAERLLTSGVKAKLAPPFDDGDKAQGFNRGILGIKLSNFAGGSTRPKVVSASSPAMLATGELLGPGSEVRKFTLKLAAVGQSVLVDDFDPN